MNPISKKYLKKHLPPDIDTEETFKLICIFIFAFTAVGFICFAAKYGERYNLLFYYENHKRLIENGIKMLPFKELAYPMLIIDLIGALLAMLYSIELYRSFVKSSQSIYLMKRLPDSGKTLRHMVFDVPLRWALCSLALSLISAVIAFLIWRFCTPAICLPA